MLDESQLQIVPFQNNIALWRKTIAGPTHAPCEIARRRRVEITVWMAVTL
jgi:hypothetical protein